MLDRLFRSLYLIRRVEEEVARVYPSDTIKSPVHLSIGQEAVSVGVCAALRPTDVVFGTYRGHALYLAKGGDLRKMIAELSGKVTGCAKGKGGSMHLIDVGAGVLGTSAVVGTTIPHAVGYAYAVRLQRKDTVVASFFGDGAVNNGAFHEGLNMAATGDLPVVYVCENNLYATEMPFHLATKNTSVASRGAAYNVPSIEVDGNDVLAVYERAGEAIQRARRGEGPTLIECLTYRWFGHHEGDPGTSYRSKEEVEAWKKRDPVKKLRQQAAASGWAAAGDFERIDAAVHKLVEEAAAFALSSPQPEIETALDHVFCS